jgi:hypothetical protein
MENIAVDNGGKQVSQLPCPWIVGMEELVTASTQSNGDCAVVNAPEQQQLSLLFGYHRR